MAGMRSCCLRCSCISDPVGKADVDEDDVPGFTSCCCAFSLRVFFSVMFFLEGFMMMFLKRSREKILLVDYCIYRGT